MLLTRSTWQEVESYLKGSKAIVVPIGSTEQHGPIGLIGTDAFTAEAVAAGLGEKAGALVGPTLALSVAQFNLGFPGTISLRATTLMAVIDDYVLSLARQGFERFYFINGHGANVSAARAAFQDIYARWSLGTMSGTPPRCRLRSWWEYPAVDALRKDWYGGGEGMHATPSEIAMTLHLLPGSQREGAGDAPAQLSKDYLRDHGGDNHWDAATHRAAFPDGRVGSHSAMATAAQGQQLLAAAIDGACEDFAAFVAEQ
ncbi:MAG: creatininase family protein [Pseudomonadota bacterium]